MAVAKNTHSASLGKTAGRPSPLLFAGSLLAIHLVWGSTYLAIRYAVETIPPLLTAGTRHLVAGIILYLGMRARGERPTLQEWRSALILGALYFLISHGGLHWAEQVVPSGLAAVLIAIEPVFIALLTPLLLGGRRPGAITWVGFVLGVAGVALLVQGNGFAARPGYVSGALVILLSAFSWAVGVVYSRRAALPRSPVLTSAMAMISGAALLWLAGFATGEHRNLDLGAIPSRSALSLLYLIVLGSLVAFTAYNWLLDHVSPTLIATHTYTNPVVAVLLGWWLAGETLSGRILLSGTLILAAILLVRRGTSASLAQAVPTGG
ncbi:MAG TPA: EamA family transporter [Terriglobales bacterium]|nr:EamA family transporter [Terriglobales bacterium]